jgi:hydrogenase maturation factor
MATMTKKGVAAMVGVVAIEDRSTTGKVDVTGVCRHRNVPMVISVGVHSTVSQLSEVPITASSTAREVNVTGICHDIDVSVVTVNR